MEKGNKDNHPIAETVDKFVEYIESLYDTLPMSTDIVTRTQESARERLKNFLLTNAIKDENNGKAISYKIKYDDLTNLKRLIKKVNSINLSARIIPESFFVSLISHYDSFLRDLIRVLLLMRPDVLNSSEKKLTFSDLLKFESLETAREQIMEKEIDAVMRESHSSQFEWLESKFSISLIKGFPSWSKFIEITERRNLYVHCNGLVSPQYLFVCSHNGLIFDKEICVGDRLEIDSEYFKNAYYTLFEIGVKLAHVLWKKLAPKDYQSADVHLNNICYELISIEDYELAANLLDFATATNQKHSEVDKKMFIINRAQTYKWMGNEAKAKEIILDEDWSACNDEFQLASSVLLDNFAKAIEVMETIGNEERMRIAYKEWPLFKEIRKDQRFTQKYKSIFNEEFCVSTVEDINNSENGKPNNIVRFTMA